MTRELTRTLGIVTMTVLLLFSIIGIALAGSLIGHYGRFPVWPGKLGAWTRDSIAVLVFCAVFSGLYLFLFVLGVAEFLVALPVQLLIWGVLWIWLLISSIGIEASADAQGGPFSTFNQRDAMFRTLEAFLWMITWIVFLYLVALVVLAYLESRRDSSPYGGPSSPMYSQSGGLTRRPAPAMSQPATAATVTV